MDVTTTAQAAWILTHTGRKFYMLSESTSDIDIQDIAHSLSHQCRYAGHCKQFYCVAEHCVLLAQYVQANFPDEGKLDMMRWALMHDASEAYLVDIPAPIKPLLTNYYKLEADLMRRVTTRFGFSDEMPQEIRAIDIRIRGDEKAQNLDQTPWDDEPVPLGIDIQFWTPAMAKVQFLRMFDRLFDESKVAA